MMDCLCCKEAMIRVHFTYLGSFCLCSAFEYAHLDHCQILSANRVGFRRHAAAL